MGFHYICISENQEKYNFSIYTVVCPDQLTWVGVNFNRIIS